METIKTTACLLDQPYSVSPFVYEGELCCLAASEGEGGACVILTAKGAITLKGDLVGGCMNLVSVPEHPNTFLTIQRFYPVFRSERAKVVMVHVAAPNEDRTADCQVWDLCDIPFVHRIGLYGGEDGLYLMAGVLCRSKQYTDDWSQPGYVAAYAFDPETPDVGEPEIIIPKLHKNHGMALYPQSSKYDMLVSGAEGVYSITRKAGQWKAAQLNAQETSDVCMLDIDGDGIDEMLTIEGFHGNTFNGYHRDKDSTWTPMFSRPLAFGHVLWCGMLNGKPCALSGSRAEGKELTLHRFERGEIVSETVLDAPCAPTQVAVLDDGGSVRIFASNTLGGEIAQYLVK